jgi:hypothetical protein
MIETPLTLATQAIDASAATRPVDVARDVLKSLRAAGYVFVTLPENVNPAEVEWSWHYRPRTDPDL